jgi:hypothetical protein
MVSAAAFRSFFASDFESCVWLPEGTHFLNILKRHERQATRRQI